MIELLRTPVLSDAYALQVALKAAGIEAAVQGEHTIGIIGGGVTVAVNEVDAAKAKAVLAEFRKT